MIKGNSNQINEFHRKNNCKPQDTDLPVSGDWSQFELLKPSLQKEETVFIPHSLVSAGARNCDSNIWFLWIAIASLYSNLPWQRGRRDSHERVEKGTLLPCRSTSQGARAASCACWRLLSHFKEHQGHLLKGSTIISSPEHGSARGHPPPKTAPWSGPYSSPTLLSFLCSSSLGFALNLLLLENLGQSLSSSLREKTLHLKSEALRRLLSHPARCDLFPT